MIAITIKGTTFDYPEQNDTAWGAEATYAMEVVAQAINNNSDEIDALTAQTNTDIATVTTLINDSVNTLEAEITHISPPNDVRDTLVSGLIEDNTWRDIPGFVLNPANVQTARIDLMVNRTGGTFKEVRIENILAAYDADAASWDLQGFVAGLGAHETPYDSQLTTIRVQPSGQVQYKAPSISSTSFKMRFRAICLGE